MESLGIAEFVLVSYYDHRIDGCYSHKCDIFIGNLRISDDSDHDWSIGGESKEAVFNTNYVNFNWHYRFNLKTNTTVSFYMDVLDFKRSMTTPILSISIPDIGYGSLLSKELGIYQVFYQTF